MFPNCTNDVPIPNASFDKNEIETKAPLED